MLLNGTKSEAFSVVAENVYYFAGNMEEDFRCPENLQAEYEALCSVNTADAIRCAALWDMQHRRGVLIGWRDGLMQVAALPLITAEQAQWMHQAFCKLQEMASQADELSSCMAGEYTIGPKLRQLVLEIMN